MAVDEIVIALSKKLPDPSEVIYALTMKDLLRAIVQRHGEAALLFSTEELLLARDEVRAAAGHYLDERELLTLGLDVWEVSRNV